MAVCVLQKFAFGVTPSVLIHTCIRLHRPARATLCVWCRVAVNTRRAGVALLEANLSVYIEKHRCDFYLFIYFLKWCSRAAESKWFFSQKGKWCVALPLTPQSHRTAIRVAPLGQSAQQVPLKRRQCRRVTHSSYFQK